MVTFVNEREKRQNQKTAAKSQRQMRLTWGMRQREAVGARRTDRIARRVSK